MDKHHHSSLTSRENFLMSLLNKVIKEYKVLLEYTRHTKPYKIVEIVDLSTIPGETKFGVQISNKSFILQLSAAEIITNGYSLKDFNEFHAEMIRRAAQGKLIEFLKISESEPLHKITAKRFDKNIQQHIFTIETHDKQYFSRTAEEIVADKDILKNLNLQDVYDIGYTQGNESILKEKIALMLAKTKKINKVPE